MRKIYRLAGTTCLVLLISLTNLKAQNVSDFENLTLTPNTYWDGSDYSGVHNSGLFTSSFSSGHGVFPNVYDTVYGEIYGYMSEGFAYSNVQDSSTVGQGFASFAYGASLYTIGSNYAIGKNGSTITLTGSSKGNTLTGMYVTNSTYSGISMRDGDYFGKIFGDSLSASGHSSVNDGTNGEDWFLLTVKGFLNGSPSANDVEFYLADFRFANNQQDYIVDYWDWLDLSQLGNVDSVQFLLTSSDTTGGFGMNTPNFFVFDDFNGIGPMSIIDNFDSNQLLIYPNPAQNIINISLELGGKSIVIIDISGKVVVNKTNLNKGITRIDISKLQSGIYFVKQGAKVEKFIKQ
ncbi:MAG: DUF4465 domain-containing protein [Vicingaceae bacterium]|nr:DUF4465 domain-containing protein [Vicingaceae bacterium]